MNQMISSGTELLSWLLAAIRIFVPTLPVPDNIAGAVSGVCLAKRVSTVSSRRVANEAAVSGSNRARRFR